MVKILNSAVFGWMVAIIIFSTTAKVSHEIAEALYEQGTEVINLSITIVETWNKLIN